MLVLQEDGIAKMLVLQEDGIAKKADTLTPHRNERTNVSEMYF